EHFAVVGQDLFGHTPTTHRPSQTVTDVPRRLTPHHVRADNEPRVIVDTRQHLGFAAVSEHEPADHIHLPQLHRPATFPPFPFPVPRTPRRRIDHTHPHQRRIHRRLRRQRLHTATTQLEHQPARTPRRMRPPQLGQHHLHRRSHLMRTRARPMRKVHHT